MITNKLNELNYYSYFIKLLPQQKTEDSVLYKEHIELIKKLNENYNFKSAQKEYHKFLIEEDTNIEINLITKKEELNQLNKNIEICLISIEVIKNLEEDVLESISKVPLIIFTSFDSFITSLHSIYKNKNESIKKDEFQIFYENNYNVFEIEKENFEYIFENVDNACFLDEETYKIKRYNNNFFEVFQNELLQENKETFLDYLHSEELLEMKEQIKTAMESKERYEQNLQFEVNNGKRIFKTTFIPLKGNNQTNNDIFCRMVDITQEIEVQEEMLLSISELELKVNSKLERVKNDLSYNEGDNQSLETTLAMIAHQWRQPLTSISLIVDDIQIKEMLGLLTNDIVKNDLQKITKNVDFLSNTINTFRNYLKNDKKSVVINASKEIGKAIETLNPILVKNQVSIEIDIEEDIKIIEKDGELKQITLNLIKNAFDAFPFKQNNKKIRVNVTRKHGKCMIVVNDNAGGIPDQIKDRIWEPYFSTKKNLNGTGLGLYMVKNMVEKHMNGQIILKTDSVGSTFVIIVPIHQD